MFLDWPGLHHKVAGGSTVLIFDGRGWAGRTFAGLWVAGRDRTNRGWGTGQTHKGSDSGMWMDDGVTAGWWLCEWVDCWMGNS